MGYSSIEFCQTFQVLVYKYCKSVHVFMKLYYYIIDDVIINNIILDIAHYREDFVIFLCCSRISFGALVKIVEFFEYIC